MAKRDYRIYKTDRIGRIVGSPVVYPAKADAVACRFAQQLVSEQDGVSVWQAGRLVQEDGPGHEYKESVGTNLRLRD